MSVGTGPLIGRAVEQAVLERAIEVARVGAGSAVLIVGSAGIGKTALLDWAAVQAPDFVVLRARGSVRSAAEPFSLLTSLVRPVAARVAALRSTERDALVSMLTGAAASIDAFPLGMALVSLFGLLAEEAPVLLEVDDVQWADASSVDVLRTACDRLSDDPIVLLFACRSEEASGLDGADIEVLEVSRLSVDESCELLADRVVPDVARRIAERSSGNPLVLRELTASLGERQRAGLDPLDETALEAPTAEAGFLGRVAELSAASRWLLMLASADSAIEAELLREVAGELGGGSTPLDSLVDLGYLVSEPDGSVLAFAHPLLRVAVYRSMSDPSRRAAHRAIAARLPEEQLHRRAWHLASAARGHDAFAADLLELAATSARGRGAHAVAGETFARSATLTADEQVRARRLSAGAQANFVAGNLDAARSMLDDAMALATDQMLRADIQLIRAMISHAQPPGGLYDELVAEAAATVQIDRSRAAMLFAHATFAADIELRTDESRKASERAAELATADEPAYHLAAFGRAGADMLAGDYELAFPVWLGFAEIVEHLGPGPDVAGMADYLVTAFTNCGDFERCPPISGPLIEYERTVGASGMLARSLAVHANYLIRTGEWLAALGTANEAVELARETNQYVELAYALVTALRIEAATGRFDDARHRANEILPICETAGMRFFELSAFAALGFFELSSGNFAAAKALLMRDRDLADAYSVRYVTLDLWQPDLVDAAVMLGDRAFAREISAQLTADAARNTIPYALALAARCRGTVAEDLGEARAEFEAALGWHEAVADPFQRARTDLAYGERLIAGGTADDGIGPLLDAAAAFAQLGAVPWQRRALRGIPDPDRRAVLDPSSPLARLSPRELQVALLVVDGRTSNDVAAELFLSRRTVEHHLAAIYRKLNLSNRTQLARVLNARNEGDRLA